MPLVSKKLFVWILLLNGRKTFNSMTDWFFQAVMVVFSKTSTKSVRVNDQVLRDDGSSLTSLKLWSNLKLNAFSLITVLDTLPYIKTGKYTMFNLQYVYLENESSEWI